LSAIFREAYKRANPQKHWSKLTFASVLKVLPGTLVKAPKPLQTIVAQFPVLVLLIPLAFPFAHLITFTRQSALRCCTRLAGEKASRWDAK
jgi:hypothetical protein